VWKKRIIAVVGGLMALAALGLVSAACGGSGNSSGGMGNMDMGTVASGQGPDVVIDIGVRNMRYEPASIEVPAGKTVQLNLRNMDGMEHDMQVDGLMVEMMDDGEMAGDHPGMSAGAVAMHTVANGTASMVFRTQQTGTFEFYCTLPGHKDGGMVGEMKVS